MDENQALSDTEWLHREVAFISQHLSEQRKLQARTNELLEKLLQVANQQLQEASRPNRRPMSGT